jgi:hypothetical protein
MNHKVEKETLRIETADDLVEALRYFAIPEWGESGPVLTFPDGLPLVSLTHVQRTSEDGTVTSELILSDECPEGAIPPRSYSCFKMG